MEKRNEKYKCSKYFTTKRCANILIAGMTQYIHKWRKNGWKSGTGAVKNQEDLKELNDLINRGVNVTWVREFFLLSLRFS